MQHPLADIPSGQAGVCASSYVEASWPGRLDGDGPARSIHRMLWAEDGEGTMAGVCAAGGWVWVCKTNKSVPTVV
jgi:hypothetical protein